MVCHVGMNKINQQIQERNYPNLIRYAAFMFPAKVPVAAAGGWCL